MARELAGSARRPGDEIELEGGVGEVLEQSEVAHVLLELSGALAEVRSVESTLQRAASLVSDIMGADRCFAATWDAARDHFHIVAGSGFEGVARRLLDESAARPGGLPILRAALLERRAPLFVPDAATEERVAPDDLEQRGARACIAIPLVRKGEEFGVLAVEFDTARAFGRSDKALAVGIARQVGVALANARRFTLLRELRAFGLNVGRVLRLPAVVDEVVSGAMRLLGSEGARVYLMDVHRDHLMPAAALGSIPREPDLAAEPWSRLLAGETVIVSRSGAPLSIDDETAVGAVGAPIMGSDGFVVAAVLAFFERSVTLGAEEAEALSVLAAHSALAIENALRYERQRHVARSLQEGLLSTDTPVLEGFEIGAVYEPASSEADIGGDFFDVFDLGGGHFGLVVGDVSGKGAEAAAQTAQAKYMLRAFAMRNASPASVLYHLNNALIASLGEDKFASCVFVVFDGEKGRCQVARAGHPEPLVCRAYTGRVEVLDLGGPILGVFENRQFDQVTVDLHAGDVLLAYTDGLVEARRGARLFGRERVEEALGRHAKDAASAQTIARLIYEDAQSFGEVTDDTVVFTLLCKQERK